jgi:hypothetical protein
VDLERRDPAKSVGGDHASGSWCHVDMVFTQSSPEGSRLDKLASTFSKLSLHETQRVIVQYEQLFRADMLGSPRVDQLLTLIQFNVFRALVVNTSALQFTMAWWTEPEAESPFNASDLDYSSELSCPVHLRPTLLQRTVEHHPWLDLFPIPELRDNILRLGDSFDDTPLCIQMLEFLDLPHEKTGLIVWGDPWHPGGWEISEDFLRKWPWVVDGCHELFISTNYWRQRRGEDKLFLGY